MWLSCLSKSGWRRSLEVTALRVARINEITVRRAGFLPRWVTRLRLNQTQAYLMY